jgi:hypothetical protein
MTWSSPASCRRRNRKSSWPQSMTRLTIHINMNIGNLNTNIEGKPQRYNSATDLQTMSRYTCLRTVRYMCIVFFVRPIETACRNPLSVNTD